MDSYVNVVLILCVLSTVSVSIEGQTTGNACSVPNNWRGTCVPIQSCYTLQKITQKPVLHQRDLNLLRASQCGNVYNWVCCPDTSTPTRPPSKLTSTSRSTTSRPATSRRTTSRPTTSRTTTYWQNTFKSTTSRTNTYRSSTSRRTTSRPTTSRTTTYWPNTFKSTTSRTTTYRPTTSRTTTSRPTTFRTTTHWPNTFKSKTSKTTTSRSTTSRPTTSRPTTSRPTTSRTTTSRPTTFRTTTHWPNTFKSKTSKITTSRSTTSRPTTSRTTTYWPNTFKSTTSRTTTYRPTTYRSTTSRPTTSRKTTYWPNTFKSTSSRPTTYRPTTYRPTTYRPTTYRSTTYRTTTSKITTSSTTTSNATTSEATTSRSTTSRSTTSRSTTSKPTMITPEPRFNFTQGITSTAHTPRISSGISVRKCNEYKEFAYNTFYTYNAPEAKDVPMKQSNCAGSTVPTVINGTEALPREFPHMALIGYRNKTSNKIAWLCGGSLVSDRFVLSAAHCSQSAVYGAAVSIRLGEHDLRQTRDAAPIDFNIIERIVHVDYEASTKYHDIVLFKLHKAVQFNDAIRPACLPEQSTISSEKPIIATGWGYTQWYGNSSNVLVKVELEIFTNYECNNNLQLKNRQLPDGIRDDIQICAGSHSYRKDTCGGDSGGPLQVTHDIHHCTYTVVGITSFGSKFCGTISTPGVYTRVHHYLSWIEGIVWPNE